MLASREQVVVNGIVCGDKRLLFPQENMVDLLSKLKGLLYSDARLRIWKERQLLAALVEAARAKVNQDRVAERHSVAVRADPTDLAAMSAFTWKKGTWNKGVYCIELDDLSELGAEGHWTSMAYKRDKVLGRTSFEGAEIVSSKSSKPPRALLLFTDLRVVGLKFSRRVWADDGHDFLRGPAVPCDGAPGQWDPQMAPLRAACRVTAA